MDIDKSIDSFTVYEELMSWAKENGLENNDLVNLRAMHLLCQEMTASSHNSAAQFQNGILGEDLIFLPREIEEIANLYHIDSHNCPALDSICPSLGGNTEHPPVQDTKASDARQKGLPCRFCGDTFRRMPDLRKHRMTCRNRPLEPKPAHPPSFDETPPKRQRAIDQYGGIGSPAVEDISDIPPVELPYTIRKKGSKTFAKTGAVDTTYEIKFNDQWNGDKLKTLHADLESMFEDVFRQTVEDIREGDLGRVVIYHQDLDGAIVVPLQPLAQLDAQTIMNHIEKVLNSHEDLLLNTSFHVQIGIIRVPRGGRSNKTLTQLTGPNNSIHLKRSLVQIVNEDDMCMSRAIAVSWCKAIKVTRDEWRNAVSGAPPKTPLIDLVLQHKKCPPHFYSKLRDKTRQEQKNLAIRLCELVGVPTDRPCSLNDIPTFEQVLKCQILVVSAERGNRFIRVGDQESDRPKLFLYLVEEPQAHFHAIVSITGFFSSSYFCHHCLKPYSNKLRHSCSETCIVCHSQECPETDTTLTCLHCHVTCRSPECFQRHKTGRTNKKNGSYIPAKCESYWKCTVCKKVLCRQDRDPQLHNCGEWKCPCCDEFVHTEHLCYQPSKVADETKPKFIFYDFECRQDEQMTCEDGYVPAGVCSTCHPEDNCPHQTKCQNCQQSWCGNNQHVPNYLVAQSACDVCKNQPVTEESKCNMCGSRCSACNKRDKKTKEYIKPPCEDTCGYCQIIFEGDGAHIEFSRWLFNDSHKDVTAIAHNNKAYDVYFLLEYMINQSMYPSKIIYAGSKIMYMELQKTFNIRIIDSLNFLPMKLAALPKAFGLTELKKGYFPHFLNTKENQNYCGSFPDPDMYGADYMGSKDRAEFMTWHSQQSDKLFDFRQEMKDYCISDVTVLREACLKFQQLMIEATGETDGDADQMTGGVDPFAQSITIASLCMKVFQSKFLKEHEHVKLSNGQTITDWVTSKLTEDGSRKMKLMEGWTSERELRDLGLTIQETETVPSPIAQVPSQGYVRRDQYSKASIQWIMWFQHQNPDYELQHALNGGEYLVPSTPYRLDAYCPKNNVAMEFQGCIFHGCRTCFPHDRSNTIQPRTKQSVDELYALTCKKRHILKSKGYKVIEIWEHEFYQQLKTTPEMKVFVNSLDLQDRLEPRDSFFGGRTNASTLHYKVVEEDEQIHYSDFTSLYPWVNKYCEYPVGHPQIIYKDFKPLEQYFGIAKVKVVPPRGLYHPVLPYRSNGKLKFPLCRTCADEEQQTPCKHTQDARSMVGTWCTPEILKAKEKGYIISKVYEVYHWAETSQYDPETGESGLFTDYINTFLKLKQQASGWPDWCESEEAKSRYIQQYQENEGIQLDKDKIEKNPGLRSLAKLCLNSFWGKFGQRLNMQQSEFIHETEADKFFLMLTDPAKEVTNFHILTDRILQLEYVRKSAFVPEDFKTNIFLATFTTAWARLKLYSVLEQLDQQVLYYDTDSIIYVARPGSYKPPLGDYLGELTNELDTNDHIVEFVSAGPKNYSYRTDKGQEVCKVRGFSLNFTNSQLINFEAIRDIVLSPKRDGTITVTNPSKICREKRKRKIYNREEKKSYQMVYTKRAVQPNLDTLPFGF